MRILITGVAGFLGRYIARSFAEQGCEVVGVDSSSPENAPLANLSSYYPLRLPDSRLGEILKQHHVQLCVHCAGRASVNFSVHNPASDFSAGPLLTFEILNTLRVSAPECRFILLSSAAIYGNPSTRPIREDHPIAPLSPYGFHKLQSELICQEFNKVYGMSTASLRIFSAYGPGLRRQVIWDICQKALTKHVVALQGTGHESRDFIHAIDIAKAVTVVAKFTPMEGEVYNVASGRETTIAELANMILAALGLNLTPQFDGVVPPGTPLNWQADITRLEAYGFTPTIPLETGLETFVEWCKREL